MTDSRSAAVKLLLDLRKAAAEAAAEAAALEEAAQIQKEIAQDLTNAAAALREAARNGEAEPLLNTHGPLPVPLTTNEATNLFISLRAGTPTAGGRLANPEVAARELKQLRQAFDRAQTPELRAQLAAAIEDVTTYLKQPNPLLQQHAENSLAKTGLPPTHTTPPTSPKEVILRTQRGPILTKSR